MIETVNLVEFIVLKIRAKNYWKKQNNNSAYPNQYQMQRNKIPSVYVNLIGSNQIEQAI